MFSVKRKHKQYTYQQTSSPEIVNEDLLNLVKEQLRISISDTFEDSYLSVLINVAYKFAENYMRRTLLTTNFLTFRDNFDVCCFELRRSPFQTLQSINYLKDNVMITLPSTDYYTTIESFYTRVLRAPDKQWPRYIDRRQQAITIAFTAGYGDAYTDIPNDMLMGMLQHIANLYESRGDCSDAGCLNALPKETRVIYEFYKISDLTTDTDCGEPYNPFYPYYGVYRG